MINQIFIQVKSTSKKLHIEEAVLRKLKIEMKGQIQVIDLESQIKLKILLIMEIYVHHRTHQSL